MRHLVDEALDGMREAANTLVDEIASTVENLNRYEVDEDNDMPDMRSDPRGEYINRDEVLDAIREAKR